MLARSTLRFYDILLARLQCQRWVWHGLENQVYTASSRNVNEFMGIHRRVHAEHTEPPVEAVCVCVCVDAMQILQRVTSWSNNGSTTTTTRARIVWMERCICICCQLCGGCCCCRQRQYRFQVFRLNVRRLRIEKFCVLGKSSLSNQISIAWNHEFFHPINQH